MTLATDVGPSAKLLELYGLNHDPAWKDVRGFRGENDWEKPPGEWNTLDITSGNFNMTVHLNGKVVNRVSDPSRRRGRILIRSKGAEIFFRKFDVILKER